MTRSEMLILSMETVQQNYFMNIMDEADSLPDVTILSSFTALCYWAIHLYFSVFFFFFFLRG